jgi:hypothetical protein
MFGVLAGMILLALSAHPGVQLNAFLSAIVLIGFWGPGVQVSLFHLSNLFPKATNTVTTLISGTFQLGFTMFMVVKVMFERAEIPLYVSAFGYAALLVVLLIAGLLMWPDQPVSRMLDDSEKLINDRSEALAQEHVDNFSNDSDDDEIEEVVLLSPSKLVKSIRDLRSIIISLKFFSLLLWMCASVFWANYYIGTVEDQFMEKYGSTIAEHYVDMFNYMLIIGTFSIPFFGMFIEKFGIGPAFLLTNFCGMMYAIGNLVGDSAIWFYSTFSFYALYRTFLFSSIFSYISSEYGFRYFGAISGILFLASSLVGLSQYALVRAFNANYTHLAQTQLSILFVCALFPLYVTLSRRGIRRTIKEWM